MTYEKEIRQIFAQFHEPWMYEAERRTYDDSLLASYGEEMDEMFAKGVARGFSVEEQVKLALPFWRVVWKRGALEQDLE